MDKNSNFDELQREVSEFSGTEDFASIPVYIARKISSDFPWACSHGKRIFSTENATKIGLIEQFIQNPEVQITPTDLAVMKEAFLNEFAVFWHRIEMVSQQYPNLKANLGDKYTEIAKIFLKGIELVDLIKRGETTPERIEPIKKELGLGNFSLNAWKARISGNYNRLIYQFCEHGTALKTEVNMFIKGLGVENPSTKGMQWNFPKDGVQYTVNFEGNILGSDRLWFKREIVFRNQGLASVLRGMVENSIKAEKKTKNITITFFPDYTDESLGNFGFSVTDDGEKGFGDVSCLDESKVILKFAKEYGDALVIVESKGKECDYVVGIGKEKANKFEHDSDYNQTRVTLLLPIEQAKEKVWRIVRKRFRTTDKQIETAKKKYDEADRARKHPVNDYRLAIARYEGILQLLKGNEDKPSLNFIAWSYHRIGNCYTHFGQLKETLAFHKKAHQLIEELFEKDWLEPADERDKFFHSSSIPLTDCYDYVTAEQRLKRSLRHRQDFGFSREELAKVKGSLGQLYTFWGRLDEAEEMLLEAIEGIKDSQDIDEIIRDENYLGMLYIKKGEFQKAKDIFKNNLKLLRDYMANNAVYLYYGLSKLYYYWGLEEGSEAKYKEAVSFADKGLEWYGEKYDELRKDDYPKGLMLKYKGCALRELKRFDNAEACLKESYTYLESSGSPNISVIGASSRLELARLYIHRNKADDLERAKAEITHSIEVINAFDVDSAQAYFEPSIKNLNNALQHLEAGDKIMASNLIRAVIENIPY